MPVDAHSKRRREDLAKLRELQAEFRGVLFITHVLGDPVTSVELEIKLETARNDRFPNEKQLANAVRIELPARYPFDPPKVTVTTPIWNPNIFTSGLICLGQKWIPTHNLGLLVQRVMQIIALEPAIINLASPANGDAGKWYANSVRRNPSLFPTVALDSLRASAQPKIIWRTIK
jgi:ubiquitin-protein ligase